MTNLEYKAYINDIMEMSNNGADLAQCHLEFIKDFNLGFIDHSQHHHLKDIYEALNSGFYDKSDFEG